MKRGLVISIIIVILILAIIFYIYSKDENNQDNNSSWGDINSLSQCEKIVNQEEKDWCIWNVAINTENADNCLEISKKTKYNTEKFLLRDYCYETLAFNIGDITLCSKISLDTSPQEPFTPEHFRNTCEDNARLKIVRDTQDTSECEFIHDAYWKERCSEKIGE